ncbi:MAG TPA: two-component regulator propeller domain-containing protein, partial [Verrucomicrobiae bacterium]|nr:two-component regulator propeller domain-containing protein [Verrucomicrobiae bacterium]
RKILATLAGLSIWVFSSTAFSAPPNYIARAWRSDQGLPQSKVTAIVQTRDGYIWLGTYSGLARFDGLDFEVFDENNTPALRNSRITSLFETLDGALWIGDESGHLTRYQNGQFEAVTFHPAWNDGKIYDIEADETGQMWIVNDAGQLARASDGAVLNPQASGVTKVVNIARSATGRIWIDRWGRVSILENGRLQTLDFGGSSQVNYVQGIAASQDGGLWVAGDERLRKWKDNRWVDWGSMPWGRDALTHLIETRNGILAAGTADHGLYLIFPGRPEAPLHFDRTTSGFPSDWVISLCEDREGNLWVGTGGGGVVMLRQSIIQTVAPADQWQNRSVLSVCPGRNGTVWAGTEGAGLYRFENGGWTNFSFNQGLNNPYIWSLAEDRQGQIWAGTWGGGLFVLKGNTFEFAPGMSNITMPMPALLATHDGKVWVGTGAGLLCYDAGVTNLFSEAGGEPLRDVRTIAQGDDGAIWFGMAGDGLACLKNDHIQRFRATNGLSSDFIECLHFDEAGALWIGTFGGGMVRYKDGRFANINRKLGLPDSVIGDIEEDDQDFFWMSSHAGIIRASQEELNQCADGKISRVHCQTYGVNDGMPTIECTEGFQPAGCKTPDGRIWFPTSKGLVNVSPRNLAMNLLPPPVQIEAMLVDEQPMTIATGQVSIAIAPGRHRFQFHYTGLSFVDPDKVRFQYRLNGFETEWVNAGGQRVADFNYVPPGHYSFQVIACNNDGVWNQTGSSVSFNVLPFFWQTLWFRTIAGFALAAGSAGAAWLGTRRRMSRKLERLEWQRAVEHERARIAHDIHDDLGAQLTRISMLSETVRSELDQPQRAAAGLNQIYKTAHELTRAMDEIVWAVNPRHDTLEGLATYLERFAQDLLAAAAIRCRLNMPSTFPPWRLTADVRHNVFLAFKEALHNVVKHSAATETSIELSIGASSFELVVKDNGNGFSRGAAPEDPAHHPARLSSGNGLENMVRRMEEIRGHCRIQSAPGQGTSVTLTGPLKMFVP